MRPIIQSKKQSKKKAKVFLVFALLLLIFLSASSNSFYVVSKFFNTVATPFWNVKSSAENAFPSSDMLLRSKTSLVQENKNLHQEIDRLTRELKGYDFVVQENLEFKKLFAGEKHNGIFAGILAHPGSLPFDTFLLDIGNEAGLVKGDLALSDGNITIGTVIETYPYSSKVKSFSSSGEITDAFLGPENIPVQLKGSGGGAYTVELPAGLDIKEGDAAVLPGSDGFILAYVESKEENITNSFQKFYLRIPLNVFELKYVQIIHQLSANE
jgi:rod shape-determining protein MreC